MIGNPKVGERVQVWYRSKVRDLMPYHGRIGIIDIVSKGKPRNHGVRIDGQVISIPAGNLRRPQ